MQGTFSPAPRVSYPDMHHGTCGRTCRDACRDRLLAVSFEVGSGENVPGALDAWVNRNFTYLIRSPCKAISAMCRIQWNAARCMGDDLFSADVEECDRRLTEGYQYQAQLQLWNTCQPLSPSTCNKCVKQYPSLDIFCHIHLYRHNMAVYWTTRASAIKIKRENRKYKDYV